MTTVSFQTKTNYSRNKESNARMKETNNKGLKLMAGRITKELNFDNKTVEKYMILTFRKANEMLQQLY